MATTTDASVAVRDTDEPPMILNLRPIIDLNDDELYELCRVNRDLRVERSARGELELMPPTGGETSDRNAEITTQLRLWAKTDATGTSFDSSGGFLLPNGAVRSPDAAWIRKSRLADLSQEQKRKFIRLCPDFVAELRSPTDSLSTLQKKMLEYLDNGARLGWLIDPIERRIFIYRPGETVQEARDLVMIAGDPVLPGFVLDLREVW